MKTFIDCSILLIDSKKIKIYLVLALQDLRIDSSRFIGSAEGA